MIESLLDMLLEPVCESVQRGYERDPQENGTGKAQVPQSPVRCALPVELIACSIGQRM